MCVRLHIYTLGHIQKTGTKCKHWLALEQGLAGLLRQGTESRCFQFCGPYSLYSLPFQHRSSPGQRKAKNPGWAPTKLVHKSRQLGLACGSQSQFASPAPAMWVLCGQRGGEQSQRRDAEGLLPPILRTSDSFTNTLSTVFKQ